MMSGFKTVFPDMGTPRWWTLYGCGDGRGRQLARFVFSAGILGRDHMDWSRPHQRHSGERWCRVVIMIIILKPKASFRSGGAERCPRSAARNRNLSGVLCVHHVRAAGARAVLAQPHRQVSCFGMLGIAVALSWGYAGSSTSVRAVLRRRRHMLAMSLKLASRRAAAGLGKPVPDFML